MTPADDDGPRAIVAVMAKEPAAGRVKSRLGAELGDEAAAALYAAMLADRCDQVRSISGVLPVLAMAGFDQRSIDPAAVPGGFEVCDQRAEGLGAGLAAASRELSARGLPVLLVDSDSPTLPTSHFVEAMARLGAEGDADVVIGPAEDGGYNLIGLRRHVPELFDDIPWSTPEVVSVTLERARRLELRVYMLPPWWDVDTARDVTRLETHLFHAWWPERTVAWLRAHAGGVTAPRPDESPAPGALWSAPWTRLSSRPVYTTPWLRVREDQVRMPDGRPTLYSVVDCGHCVGVLPFVDPDTVLLVQQYRYVADRVTWEMPTGGVDGGEDPRVAAARELREEAGVDADTLEALCAYHTSKSVMDETAHLFVARGLTEVGVRPDDTEFIRVAPMAFEEALERALSGEIVDSMTVVALLRVALSRKSGHT